ncbi:MAG TPA: hypothetical protein IAC66_06405 [Candidatus Aphodousia gallistercoris]|nr:hypothetical protein [Candidatus Aphodousia gallistercoris]
MPIYIYRGGPGRGPQNPLIRLLVSLAVLAGVIALGIFLLPIIGAMALIFLAIAALVIVGGMVYRWIYGDPLKNFMERQNGVRVNPEFRATANESAQEKADSGRLGSRFRRRQEEVEDAVVVEEFKKEPRQDER